MKNEAIINPHKRNSKKNKIFNIFILYLITINLVIFNLSSENTKRIFYSKESFITLKINSIGETQLFHYNDYASYDQPDEIYINGDLINNTKNIQYLNRTENVIKLLWKDEIFSTGYMFYGCQEIKEINLSNFNSSQVTDMHHMFTDCKKLIFVDFTNF